MNWLSGIFTYCLIWWITLFLVLPWGNAPSDSLETVTMPGAPDKPRLKQKCLITTILAAGLWLIVFAAIESNVLSFRDLVKDMPD